MTNFGLPAALAIIILWPLGIFVCMRSYFKARRRSLRMESWTWFLLWCLLITFIEWWIISIMQVTCVTVGAACGIVG